MHPRQQYLFGSESSLSGFYPRFFRISFFKHDTSGIGDNHKHAISSDEWYSVTPLYFPKTDHSIYINHGNLKVFIYQHYLHVRIADGEV